MAGRPYSIVQVGLIKFVMRMGVEVSRGSAVKVGLHPGSVLNPFGASIHCDECGDEGGET